MNNVWCVGGNLVNSGTRAVYSASCGWKGRREGGNTNLGPLDAVEFYAELHKLMVAKPCPRCGGRVELIQPQPSP